MREIQTLIRVGERFEARTLETEWSLALLRGIGRAPDPAPFSRAYFAGRAAALALSDVESQQGPEAAWERWDEMMGYADAVDGDLIDRYNAEASAGGGDHAIPC
ncbi:MAG: hypothetical protein ACYDEV_09180 [Acidiferrobacter sp.]